MIRSIAAGLLALGGLATCGPGDTVATDGKRPLEGGTPRPTWAQPSITAAPNGWRISKDCDSLTFSVDYGTHELSIQSGVTQWPIAFNVVVPAGEAFSVDLTGEHTGAGVRLSAFVNHQEAVSWEDC